MNLISIVNTYSPFSSATPNVALPEDQGLLAWTFDPLFTTTSSVITNGTVYLAAIKMRSAGTRIITSLILLM